MKEKGNRRHVSYRQKARGEGGMEGGGEGAGEGR